MRVALCKIQEFSMLGKKTSPNEPSHLLGMHNDLLMNGIQSAIIDNAITPWREAVKAFSPDIVGITAPVKSQSAQLAKDINELKKSGVRVILGGIFATANPVFYAEELKPDAIVLGQGEPVMREFIERDFIFDRAKSSPFYLGDSGETSLFYSKKLLPLDEINYRRPYFLGAYDQFSWAHTVYGCNHRCIFCTSDGRVTYRSPELALSEMLYLRNALGAEISFPIGGDFTSNPKQATEIVRGISSHEELLAMCYDFNVRLDTLSSAIKTDPSAWKRLFNESEGVVFMPGLESFDPGKLVRLGKYRTLSAAKGHFARFVEVMEFLKGTKAVMMPNFIMYDPESKPGEILLDLGIIENLIERYPGQLSIADGEIFNYLKPVDGSEANGRYEASGDDFFFPVDRHPINLTLLMYFVMTRTPATRELEGVKDVSVHQGITLKHIGFLRQTMRDLKKRFASGMDRNADIIDMVGAIVREQFHAGPEKES